MEVVVVVAVVLGLVTVGDMAGDTVRVLAEELVEDTGRVVEVAEVVDKAVAKGRAMGPGMALVRAMGPVAGVHMVEATGVVEVAAPAEGMEAEAEAGRDMAQAVVPGMVPVVPMSEAMVVAAVVEAAVGRAAAPAPAPAPGMVTVPATEVVGAEMDAKRKSLPYIKYALHNVLSM